MAAISACCSPATSCFPAGPATKSSGRSAFPWEPLAHLFHQADWVAGNLEGAVGPRGGLHARASASPCFDIPGALVPLLAKAGFRALGTANNHALDLGPGGRAATRQALIQAGLRVLSFEDSPVFVTAGGRTLGVIAVSTVPSRDGSRTEIPSTALRQKLRLASGLSDMVVVFVHWGSELLEWPDTQQRVAAAWLVAEWRRSHRRPPSPCRAGRGMCRGTAGFLFAGQPSLRSEVPGRQAGVDCRLPAARGRTAMRRHPTMAPPGSAFPQLSQSVDGGATDALKACAVHSPVLVRLAKSSCGAVNRSERQFP